MPTIVNTNCLDLQSTGLGVRQQRSRPSQSSVSVSASGQVRRKALISKRWKAKVRHSFVHTVELEVELRHCFSYLSSV